jgi:CheY-like chemotaxis protein
LCSESTGTLQLRGDPQKNGEHMRDPAQKPKPFVLLVEDEKALREHLADALSDEFEVQAAGSGEDALAAVLKRHPELIVTDILLPGIDGVELTRLLRNTPSTASIPVLMMSGRTAEELRHAHRPDPSSTRLTAPEYERQADDSRTSARFPCGVSW